MANGDFLERIKPVSQQMDEFLNPRLKIQNDLTRAMSAGRSTISPNDPYAPEQMRASDNIARAMSNIRQVLGRNVPTYRTEAEQFEEATQGLDLTRPENRAAAVQAATRISPAMGRGLADVFMNQDIQLQSQTRFPTYQNTYADGTTIIGTSTSPDPIIIKDGESFSVAKGNATPEELAEMQRLAIASGPAMAFDKSAATAAGQEEGGARSTLLTETVNNAVNDAYALKDLRLTLKLLTQIKTGGIDEALKRNLETALGTTDVNTGRLVNLLGTNVLGQLRNIFGASFTAEEGEQLKQISAGINNSPEANMGIILNIIRKYEDKMRQGLQAEKQLGTRNAYAMQQMEDALNETGIYEIRPEEYSNEIDILVGRYLYDDLGLAPGAATGPTPTTTPGSGNGQNVTPGFDASDPNFNNFLNQNNPTAR